MDKLDTIIDLLDIYMSKCDTFRNSNTCNSATYEREEQDMYDARYLLLNFIEANLKE